MPEPVCFVLMPFKPEMHFLWLFIRQHMKKVHHVQCHRADSSVTQGAFIDKIRGYFRKADLLIAECSGGSANVFYELGIAHERRRHVILLSSSTLCSTI